MKKSFFFMLLAGILPLLLPAQPGPKQVLIEAKFVEGKIDLILPDDVRANEWFSAGIKILPAGEKEKLISKNKEVLSSDKIQLGDQNFSAGLSHVFLKLSDPELKDLGMKIMLPSGKVLQETKVFMPENRQAVLSPSFLIPDHILTGSSFRVFGPFDGDASTTKCSVDNNPLQVIAESPRQCIIDMPADAKGWHTLRIEENGKSAEQKVSGVDMIISTGPLDLLRGQSSWVEVLITGLDNLDDNASLSLQNLASEVITFEGGNVQLIPIPPASVSGQGQFKQRFAIVGVQRGTFNVNINLDLPEKKSGTVPPSNGWVACKICGGVIMPQNTVDQITQLSKNKWAAPPPYEMDTVPNGWWVHATINPDNMVALQMEMDPAFEPSFVTYSYSTPAKKEEKIIACDSFPVNHHVFSLPANSLTSGIYNVKTTAYNGDNFSYSVQQPVLVLPVNYGGITNPLINEYRRRIQQVKDSIDNLQRIIDNGNRRIYENYPEKRRLDSIARAKQGYYYQLVQIDAVLETLPKVYGDTLNKLLDSLKRFKQKVPELPDIEELKKRVASLEAALKACQDHLNALQQEQKDLQNEMTEVEAKQSAEVQKILDCFKNAGYDYAGHTSRNSKTGEFGYGYTAVKDGQAVDGIPAQCLKTVSDAKKNIDQLKQRYREIRERLKNIPAEINQAKADCDRISKELQQAAEALRKGKNALVEYGFIHSDMDDICRQIKGMLDPLVIFCKQHPEICNAESMVESLMANCPQPGFWDGFNNLVNYKKGIEDGIKKQADDAQRQVDRNREEERRINEDIYKAKQEQDRKAAQLPGIIQKEEAETEAELVKRTTREDSARAIRRRDCEEFLKTQSTSKEEEGWIETILKVKKQIQGLGGQIKKASEYGDQLTRDRYKEITDSLRSIIDKLIEPLKQYDKLKKKIDELTGIKDDLQKLFSEATNDRDRAEKFKIILRRIHEQLEKIAEDFPILKLFTAYFGYLVDSYGWAVDKSYETQQRYFRRIFEQCLGGDKCRILVNEYLKRKNLDDVYSKAWQLCKGDDLIDPLLGTSERRRVAMEELQKVVLKLLTDCCLSELGM